MSTKPFSLQSPEQIAKDYGGNKQKIAQAAQMGLVDSTAAVLAGMFIDRMRSAQMLEQQPQQTVAQQVLSPQPQAAPPPAPPQGGAPMGMAGAPPVGGLQQRLGMATQQGGTPVPAPQAAGPGFAEGGLASLPVPDSMFDEPSGGGFNEGYAGGGIVAFAGGGAVYRVGGEYVYADGSPAPAPEPGTVVMRGAKPLFGGDYIPSGETAVVPGGPPTTERGSGIPVRQYGAGERMPFGESLVGRGVGDVLNALSNRTPEAQRAFARGRREQEASQRERAGRAREQARYEYDLGVFNTLGGKKPTPPAAPAARPVSTAKPAAAKPATTTPRAGGITPRAPAPAPAVAPTAPRVGVPSAPRVGVPSAPRVGAPSAPRVGGSAPAGPALSASPAAVPGGAPFTLGGMSEDPAANIAALKALAPQDTTMRDAMAKRYADMSSPEALAAQKKQDFWGALAQIGFGMAGSNSPYFLQAAGQSASAALPGMQQAAQARKAQEMAGLQGQLGIENLTNQERQSLATRATELSEQRRKGLIDQQQFAEQMALKREELDMEREYKRAMAGAAGARASRSGAADEDAEFSNSLAQQLAEVNYNQAMALAPQRRAAAGDAYKRNPQVWDRAYQQSVRARALEYGAKRAAELSRGRGRRDRRDESAPSSTAADFTYVEGKGLVPTQQ